MKEFDISCEEWREYDLPQRTYRITNPLTLYVRDGGTTHRIVDAEGMVHCAPVPGDHGCVLRWKNREGQPAVKF